MVNGQWIDIAGIVFACTAANHLGLIQAVETVIRRRLPIVSCVKCLTFWAVLVYELWRVGFSDIPAVLAISFLCAWASIWLDLFMGIIDHIYLIIYEQIYPTANTADTDAISAEDPVPDVPDGHS